MAKDNFKRNLVTAAALLAVTLFGLIIGGYMMDAMPAQDHTYLRSELSIIYDKPITTRQKEQEAGALILSFFTKGAKMESVAQFVMDSDGTCNPMRVTENSETQPNKKRVECEFVTSGRVTKWQMAVTLFGKKDLVEEIDVILH